MVLVLLGEWQLQFDLDIGKLVDVFSCRFKFQNSQLCYFYRAPLLFGGSFVGLWRCVTKLSLKAKFLNLCKIAQAFFLFSVSLK